MTTFCFIGQFVLEILNVVLSVVHYGASPTVLLSPSDYNRTRFSVVEQHSLPTLKHLAGAGFDQLPYSILPNFLMCLICREIGLQINYHKKTHIAKFIETVLVSECKYAESVI